MSSEVRVPPGWPAPPAGWIPRQGWRPDPNWAPPPEGWWTWLRDNNGDLAWVDATNQPAPGPEFVVPDQFSPPTASPVPPAAFADFGQPPQEPRHRHLGWKIWTAIGGGAFVLLVLLLVIVGATTGGKHSSGKHVATPAPALSNIPSDELPAETPGFPSDTPTTPAPTGPATASFGTPATITQDGSDAATLTIDQPSLSASEGDGFITPKNGQFLLFKVTFAGVGQQTFDYNPFDFYVRDAQGQHYQPSFGHDPALNAGTLQPSETVSGYLTMDAPAHGTLVYSPNFGGASVAEWSY